MLLGPGTYTRITYLAKFMTKAVRAKGDSHDSISYDFVQNHSQTVKFVAHFLLTNKHRPPPIFFSVFFVSLSKRRVV